MVQDVKTTLFRRQTVKQQRVALTSCVGWERCQKTFMLAL